MQKDPSRAGCEERRGSRFCGLVRFSPLRVDPRLDEVDHSVSGISPSPTESVFGSAVSMPRGTQAIGAGGVTGFDVVLELAGHPGFREVVRRIPGFGAETARVGAD